MIAIAALAAFATVTLTQSGWVSALATVVWIVVVASPLKVNSPLRRSSSSIDADSDAGHSVAENAHKSGQAQGSIPHA